jgi:hypothetical protein
MINFIGVVKRYSIFQNKYHPSYMQKSVHTYTYDIHTFIRQRYLGFCALGHFPWIVLQEVPRSVPRPKSNVSELELPTVKMSKYNLWTKKVAIVICLF